MRTDRDPFVTMVFIIAFALTAPRVGGGQGPAVRPDSTALAPAVAGDDAWYPEGPVRIRGKRYSLFVGATYTWFMNGNSRARFGEGTWSPSFELYRPQRHGWSPLLELNDTRIASTDSTARVFAASAGVRYRPVDAEPSRWLALSVGLAAGPRVVRISGLERTTVFGIHAQVGVEILRTARVTVRYDAVPTVHRTRLSTMSLGTALRLPPYGKERPRREPRDTSVVATCARAGCAR
jgi:hypothetical protein